MGLIYAYKVNGCVKYVGQTIRDSVLPRHNQHVCVAFSEKTKNIIVLLAELLENTEKKM